MAATITELSVADIPCNKASGTGTAIPRCMVFFQSTTASSGSSVNLQTYIPGVADVEGIMYVTSNGAAVSSGSATWSTYTVTLGTGLTTPKVGIIARYK